MKIISVAKTTIADIESITDDVLVSSNRNQCGCTDTYCGCGL